jgi:hypothetical protein
VEGEVFLAASAQASVACRYRVMEESFRAVAGWPQGGRYGVGGGLDTVRSGGLLRHYEMALIVEEQPSAPERGSMQTLRALYEGDGTVWFAPPDEATSAVPAYLIGELKEATLGPLQGGSGAFFLVPVRVTTTLQN